MAVLKNICIILFSFVIFSQARVVEPGAKPNPQAERDSSDAEYNNAQQLLFRFRAFRSTLPHDSVEVTAAFRSAVSAFKAISDKYPSTNVDSRALSILFVLQQLMGEQKTAKLTKKIIRRSLLCIWPMNYYRFL